MNLFSLFKVFLENHNCFFVLQKPRKMTQMVCYNYIFYPISDFSNNSAFHVFFIFLTDVCGYKPSQHSFLLVTLAMLINYKRV